MMDRPRFSGGGRGYIPGQPAPSIVYSHSPQFQPQAPQPVMPQPPPPQPQPPKPPVPHRTKNALPIFDHKGGEVKPTHVPSPMSSPSVGPSASSVGPAKVPALALGGQLSPRTQSASKPSTPVGSSKSLLGQTEPAATAPTPAQAEAKAPAPAVQEKKAPAVVTGKKSPPRPASAKEDGPAVASPDVEKKPVTTEAPAVPSKPVEASAVKKSPPRTKSPPPARTTATTPATAPEAPKQPVVQVSDWWIVHCFLTALWSHVLLFVPLRYLQDAGAGKGSATNGLPAEATAANEVKKVEAPAIVEATKPKRVEEQPAVAVEKKVEVDAVEKLAVPAPATQNSGESTKLVYPKSELLRMRPSSPELPAEFDGKLSVSRPAGLSGRDSEGKSNRLTGPVFFSI